jgi:hypothetical protein
LPFLFIRDHACLVAPWPKTRALSDRQEAELHQVARVMQERAGRLPPVAWIDITGQVTALQVEAPWIARKLHDQHVIPLGAPARKPPGRISPSASRVWRELASAATQP